MNYIWIFIGGGIGSLFRAGLTDVTKKFWSGVFPLPTLLVNLVACAALGIFFALLKDRIQQNDWMFYLLVVGFCGGFSTFSAFTNETLELFRKGLVFYGVLNVMISISFCLAVLALIRK